MTRTQVHEWIDIGLELQFEYNGKGYYIGPYWNKNKVKAGIIFYEDYQDDIIAKDIDALWKSKYHGLIVGNILEAVPEDQVDGRI